jgi:hypothetical protein
LLKYGVSNNSHVNEKAPEIILKCGRIFQPKNEHVSARYHSRNEEDLLVENCIFEMNVENTHVMWQWTIHVPKKSQHFE